MMQIKQFVKNKNNKNNENNENNENSGSGDRWC
jgi:hypothetical protein